MKNRFAIKSLLSVCLAVGLVFSPLNFPLVAQSASLLDETPLAQEVITDGGDTGEPPADQPETETSTEAQPSEAVPPEAPVDPDPKVPAVSESPAPAIETEPAVDVPFITDSPAMLEYTPAVDSTSAPADHDIHTDILPADIPDAAKPVEVLTAEQPVEVNLTDQAGDPIGETQDTPEGNPSEEVSPSDVSPVQETAKEPTQATSSAILVRYSPDTSLEELTARLSELGYTVSASDSESKALLVNVPAGQEVVLAGQLQAMTGVQSAGAAYEASILELIPDDPLYPLQTYLQTIQAPGGWQYFTGSSKVIVAVIDTGIDLSNPEFTGRLVQGYDFINDDPDAMDDHGHGTHVAGTIAATGNNGTGITGLDWSAKIMPVKVLNSAGKGTEMSVYNGIIYAVDHGAKIINLSLGFNGYSELVASAVAYANAHGVTLVAAGGNSGSNTITFPASLPQVIAVGSVNNDGSHAYYSNTGSALDVVAPGTNIFSTNLGGPTYKTGTSMSTAEVTGLVSLLKGIYPLTTGQIETNLQVSSKDLGTSGWDKTFGHGLIQVRDAILQLFHFMTLLEGDKEGEEESPTPVFYPTFTPTPTFLPRP